MAIDAAFRNTGPVRYCAHCKVQRSTYSGKFVLHFLPNSSKKCPNSEQPVPKAKPDQEPAHAASNAG